MIHSVYCSIIWTILCYTYSYIYKSLHLQLSGVELMLDYNPDKYEFQRYFPCAELTQITGTLEGIINNSIDIYFLNLCDRFKNILWKLGVV